MVENICNEYEKNNDEEFRVVLSGEGRINCLKSIEKRLVRSLYVYEESEKNEEYDYKAYVNSVLWFVCSANELLNGEITSVIVHLNSIMKNEFDKKTFKKIILECKNLVDYLLKG